MFWTGKRFVNKFTPMILNPKPACETCGRIMKKPPNDPCEEFKPDQSDNNCKNWEEF